MPRHLPSIYGVVGNADVAVTGKVRRVSDGVGDLGLQVVWCPKYRRPVLAGRVAARLAELIRKKADERGWKILSLDVLAGQVVKHDSKSSASYVASQYQGFTSRVLRAEFAHVRSRLPTLWSVSYVVATVGAVSAEAVREYLDTQWERA